MESEVPEVLVACHEEVYQVEVSRLGPHRRLVLHLTRFVTSPLFTLGKVVLAIDPYSVTDRKVVSTVLSGVHEPCLVRILVLDVCRNGHRVKDNRPPIVRGVVAVGSSHCLSLAQGRCEGDISSRVVDAVARFWHGRPIDVKSLCVQNDLLVNECRVVLSRGGGLHDDFTRRGVCIGISCLSANEIEIREVDTGVRNGDFDILAREAFVPGGIDSMSFVNHIQ